MKLRNDAFYRRIRQHPQLSDPLHPPSGGVEFSAPVETVQVGPHTRYPSLRTPPLDDSGATVDYDILDLDKHMDSSEMTPAGRSCRIGCPGRPADPGRMEQHRSAGRGELGPVRGFRHPIGNGHLGELAAVGEDNPLDSLLTLPGIHRIDLDVPVHQRGKAHPAHRSTGPPFAASVGRMDESPGLSVCRRPGQLCRRRCRLCPPGPSRVPASLTTS